MAKRKNMSVKIDWSNKFYPNLFDRTNEKMEEFAEQIVQEATNKHAWKDNTGQITADMEWDRIKNVVALKVNNPVGVWLELGFHHSKSMKLIRKPGLSAAFAKNKGRLIQMLKGIL